MPPPPPPPLLHGTLRVGAAPYGPAITPSPRPGWLPLAGRPYHRTSPTVVLSSKSLPQLLYVSSYRLGLGVTGICLVITDTGVTAPHGQ